MPVLKYVLNWRYVRRFLRKMPQDVKFVTTYLRRADKLIILLNVEKRVIRGYLTEAEKVRQYVTRKLEEIRGFHGAMTSPLEGPVIYAVVRDLRPQVVVETGVANGASTTFILSALEENGDGELYSIDAPSMDLSVKEIGWLVPRHLRSRWRLIMGKSEEKLIPLLEDVGPIDVFLHDSLHAFSHVLFELEAANKHLNVNGVLIADDVNPNWIKEMVRRIRPTRYEVFYDLLVALK